jgi:hypothetical protein
MDRMVAREELLEHFGDEEIVRCDRVDVELEEGPLLRGRAGVVRLIARKV